MVCSSKNQSSSSSWDINIISVGTFVANESSSVVEILVPDSFLRVKGVLVVPVLEATSYHTV